MVFTSAAHHKETHPHSYSVGFSNVHFDIHNILLVESTLQCFRMYEDTNINASINTVSPLEIGTLVTKILLDGWSVKVLRTSVRFKGLIGTFSKNYENLLT